MLYSLNQVTAIKVLEPTDCELVVDLSISYIQQAANVFISFDDQESVEVILQTTGTSVYRIVVPPNTGLWARSSIDNALMGVHIVYKR